MGEYLRAAAAVVGAWGAWAWGVRGRRQRGVCLASARPWRAPRRPLRCTAPCACTCCTAPRRPFVRRPRGAPPRAAAPRVHRFTGAPRGTRPARAPLPACAHCVRHTLRAVYPAPTAAPRRSHGCDGHHHARGLHLGGGPLVPREAQAILLLEGVEIPRAVHGVCLCVCAPRKGVRAGGRRPTAALGCGGERAPAGAARADWRVRSPTHAQPHARAECWAR